MADEDYLREMGFPEDKIKIALAEKGHLGLQAAMEWLLEHADDPVVSGPVGGNQTPVSSAGVIKGEYESYDGENSESVSTKASIEPEAPSSEQSEEGPIDPNESEASKAERVKKLQDKIAQRRQQKEEEDKQYKIEQEKRRRKEGQDLAKMKADLAYRETQKIVEQRKREKLEDKLARQRVKDMIAEDRANKKREREKQQEEQSKPTTTTTPAVASVKSNRPAPTDARLQIVCPDGSKMVQTFSAQEPLSAVRVFVKMNRKDSSGEEEVPFGLMSAFPKKVFTDLDYDAPLNALGLAPSAVLHVTKQATQ